MHLGVIRNSHVVVSNRHFLDSWHELTIRVHWQEVDCIQHLNPESLVRSPVGSEEGDGAVFLSAVHVLPLRRRSRRFERLA